MVIKGHLNGSVGGKERHPYEVKAGGKANEPNKKTKIVDGEQVGVKLPLEEKVVEER